MLKSPKYRILAGVTVVASLAVIAGVGACSSNNNPAPAPAGPSTGLGVTGTDYSAALSPVPLNSQFGDATGNIVITNQGGQFTVNITGSGFAADQTHLAFIYNGTQCPTAANDVNGDGVIDASEALTSAGQILIPLNGDLNQRDIIDTNYPMADVNGNLTYNVTGNAASLIASLGTQPTANPSASPSATASATPSASPSVTASASPTASPSVTASASPSTTPVGGSLFATVPNGNLDLTGMVVMIHGIASNVFLPATVVDIGGFGTNATVPVVCGVLQQGLGAGPSPSASPSTSPSPSASPSTSPSTSPSPSPSASPSVTPSTSPSP